MHHLFHTGNSETAHCYPNKIAVSRYDTIYKAKHCDQYLYDCMYVCIHMYMYISTGLCTLVDLTVQCYILFCTFDFYFYFLKQTEMTL